MIDERELAGASDSVTDAPSLQASRASKRPPKPSQRLLASQGQEQTPVPIQRKRKQQFTIHEDLITPPSTQATSYSSQTEPQKTENFRSQPKKHTRASKTSPEQLPEIWEQNFNNATNKATKFQVLIEALGHEDFTQKMHIPERATKANLDEELDPLNPLWLWSKFIPSQVLQTIAEHTNEHESLHFEARNHSVRERPWKDVSGADIGAFLGAAMLMGVHPQSCLEDYWNTSEDKPVFPIQQYISRERFEQICRYLKVNSPSEDLPESRYFDKLEPLLSTFRTASQSLVDLPDTVSIDENLITARTRTIHLMQIDKKAAGKGFKIYTLCSGYYLYDWIYTSKASKVPQAKQYPPSVDGPFTDAKRMVLTLVKAMIESHPPTFRFQVVFDNFFSTTRLFDQLREWGVGAYGTAKKGSGMPLPHILLNSVATKERNYGEVVNTVVLAGRINCITFIDQGAVWMMSTVHDTANKPQCWRPIIKRKKASDHLSQTTATGEVEIPYPQISNDYNHYMNGSDLCQQLWDEYPMSKHAHRRNWWPLFWHLIHASISNYLYIYRLEGFTNREISHL
jgi:hypothetical protein